MFTSLFSPYALGVGQSQHLPLALQLCLCGHLGYKSAGLGADLGLIHLVAPWGWHLLMLSKCW